MSERSPTSPTSPSQPQANQPADDNSAQSQHDELTLDRLSQAFASMLGQEEQLDAPPGDSVPPEMAAAGQGEHSSDDHSASGDGTPADAACEINPSTILEAMLFVGRPDNQPLTSAQIAGLMRGVSVEEIDEQIQQLNSRYAAENRPYEIAAEGDGYRLTLRSEQAPVRERYQGRMRRARLSQAAIEVLAVVAYNQPVTSERVARLRGKPSGHVLSHLVRRKLLRSERPTTKPRKAKFSTTTRFLEIFRLKGLEDLPRSEELELQ